jgi:prepilin-type N-terminal cleavage/methylation domain-containing protein
MRSKGFTLVEILVVVVIMAIVISLAVLSIGVTGRDSQLDWTRTTSSGIGSCPKAWILNCSSIRRPSSSNPSTAI